MCLIESYLNNRFIFKFRFELDDNTVISYETTSIQTEKEECASTTGQIIIKIVWNEYTSKAQ